MQQPCKVALDGMADSESASSAIKAVALPVELHPGKECAKRIKAIGTAPHQNE